MIEKDRSVGLEDISGPKNNYKSINVNRSYL